MNKSQTVTDKVFYYDGELSHGLTIRTCNKQGKIKDKGFFISPGTIDIIKRAIITRREISMGACRDNPAKDSIGYILYQEHKSPQTLCYVIPLLKQEKFCTYFKKGNAYFIRYITEN